jgi:hypothetical protein
MAQHREDVGMRRARVVVKKFDPPVTLSADLPGGLQNDLLQQLSAVDRFDCANQAMTAMRVAQPAFAPLLLCGEQPFDRPELSEWMGFDCLYSVERHVLSPITTCGTRCVDRASVRTALNVNPRAVAAFRSPRILFPKAVWRNREQGRKNMQMRARSRVRRPVALQDARAEAKPASYHCDWFRDVQSKFNLKIGQIRNNLYAEALIKAICHLTIFPKTNKVSWLFNFP